ncbi:MAG: ribonuclease P protein component [Clostridia bacterium]|nr:ribonuclease P protein component [Clostridia bacterium]
MQSAYRLKKNASFSYVYKKGSSLSSPILVLSYVPARSNKVGVSVSKKVGKSVTRSLVKRRIYENFASFMPLLNGNHNYVVIAKEGIVQASFIEIGESLKLLLRKAGHLDV